MVASAIASAGRGEGSNRLLEELIRWAGMAHHQRDATKEEIVDILSDLASQTSNTPFIQGSTG